MNALTISQLAALMRRYADRAFDPDLRSTSETDAMLLGELTMLDVICDPLWVSDRKMSASEEQELGAAREQLGNAWDHLNAIVNPSSRN